MFKQPQNGRRIIIEKQKQEIKQKNKSNFNFIKFNFY